MGKFSLNSIRGQLLVHNLIELFLLIFFLVLTIFATKVSSSRLQIQRNLSEVSSALLPITRYAMGTLIATEEYAETQEQLFEQITTDLRVKVKRLMGDVTTQEGRAMLEPIAPAIDSLIARLAAYDHESKIYFDGVDDVFEQLKLMAPAVWQSGEAGQLGGAYSEFTVELMVYFYEEEVDEEALSGIEERLQSMVAESAGTSAGLDFEALVSPVKETMRLMESYVNHREAICARIEKIGKILTATDDAHI